MVRAAVPPMVPLLSVTPACVAAPFTFSVPPLTVVFPVASPSVPPEATVKLPEDTSVPP